MKLLDYETITMQSDQLDDGSVVVNFDVVDDSYMPTRQGGYVMTRQENDYFMVTVFNKEGDVLSETVVPFDFTDNEA
jgi:hypothetical protein